MYNLKYDIIYFNIRLFNIKLKKLDLIENMLLASKPPIVFKSKYRMWENKLNEIIKEKEFLYNELMIEYQKNKILSSK